MFQWGLPGDIPLVTKDVNGFQAPVVVRNVSGSLYWYTLGANGGAYNITTTPAQIWGFSTDTPLMIDVDADGIPDPVVVRASGGLLYWYMLPSNDFPGGYFTQWGLVGYIPQ